MHPTSHITESSSIFEAFEKIAKQIPDKAIYKYKSSSTWIAEKYCVAANKIYSQANFLKQQNTTPDSKVAIISGTRPEWSLWDLAILGNGFITIGVYPSLPAEDIGIILYDSSATTLILENEEQVKKILYLCENEITIPEIEEKPSFKTKLKFTTLIIIEEIDSKIFDELKKYISTIVYSHNIQENYDYTPVKRSREDTASIVYTSGTTGVPKGVIQTHGNHLSNVEQAIVSGMFGNDGTLFLYLPLAHSFARLMNYLGMVMNIR